MPECLPARLEGLLHLIVSLGVESDTLTLRIKVEILFDEGY